MTAHEYQIVASVPDLISVLDAQNGRALGTPDYKYGLRVVSTGISRVFSHADQQIVLGVTASPQWTETERGLELGDLRAFGYAPHPSNLL